MSFFSLLLRSAYGYFYVSNFPYWKYIIYKTTRFVLLCICTQKTSVNSSKSHGGKNVVIDQQSSILTFAYIFSRLLCRVIGYFLLLRLSLINAIKYLTDTINNAVKNATSISKLKDTSILSPPLTF